MKKIKKFDCVQMKNEIQQKILREIEGLSLEQRRKRTEKRIASDPILGPIWKGARRIKPDESSPAVSSKDLKKEKRLQD